MNNSGTVLFRNKVAIVQPVTFSAPTVQISLTAVVLFGSGLVL